MPYTQKLGRGPINKYGALQQKGLIGDSESLHARAKRLHGGKTTKEKLNPFDKQSKRKRQYKRQESLDGNFNWKDSLRTTFKVLGAFAGGLGIGRKMQSIAEDANEI
tara:strand:- start:546 stop:866 length:321 start_codon:yes stop_codon:yes gene_type:complete